MNGTLLQVIDRLVGDRDVVFRFFAVFSRFEYALKASGFVKKGRSGEALPDWESYATDLRGKFAEVGDERFKSACVYFAQRPPNTQVLTSRGLGWRINPRRQDDFDEKYLLRLVRAVRHNLFHGGKYPREGLVPDVARNRELLEAGISVLQWCLALSPNVKEAYEHDT
jgi:hypothetical protein